MNGDKALVGLLERHGVTHLFGIPGAKIDRVFIPLAESSIELVVCRHERNAAFMAQAMGRLTGTVVSAWRPQPLEHRQWPPAGGHRCGSP